MTPHIVHETANRLRLRLASAKTLGAQIAARIDAVPGVRAVRLNIPARSLVVGFNGQPGTRAAILAAIHDPVPEEAALTDEWSDLGQVVLSGALLGAVLILPPPLKAALTALNIAGVVTKGFRHLFSRGLTVEVLDAIAVTVPTVRGEWLTANFARFLLDLGTYIEASTTQESEHLLRELLRMSPERVAIESDDGRVIEVDYCDVTPGARVVVGTGKQVPVDGLVYSGQAFVNQSAVTGESLPIPKEGGDEVLAGTVVEEGRLIVVAERVGDTTTTARISRYIQDALRTPAEIQCESDRQADKRVLITLASGAGVFALTRDWQRLESVFLVDYSCAVKFGTPIAIKAAMYRAAKANCLIKSGRALESLAAVDTVVFDKTGTLTHNTLEVTDIERPCGADIDEAELLALVASLAEHTSHPIASAVVDLARRRHLAHISHEEVDFLVGHGIASTVHGHVIRIGSRHYLEEHEGVSFGPFEGIVERLAKEGKSMLFVSWDGAACGVIGLRDRLRVETPTVLRQLRAQGVQNLIMITGDHEATARQVGDKLGLDRVYFNQKPEDKASIIAALKAEGRTVAFVGDGVNDGPALMAADVGIAMPCAADIARATADIVMLDDQLEGLSMLRDLATETIALIRSNFDASLSINSAILGGAALGWLSPVVTSALHNGTTIALLLRAMASSRAKGKVRSVPAFPSSSAREGRQLICCSRP